MSLNILISPSGNLYGSEQVLMDYLAFSRLKYSVYVSGRGLLYNALKQRSDQHEVYSFGNVRLLYLKIFVLCAARKVSSVYVNEAGHTKYIFLLARIFGHVKFILHVRLIEDTSKDRWPRSARPANVIVLSISKYISSKVPYPNFHLYDPYIFQKSARPANFKRDEECLTVGIIGRISVSKGVDTILKMLQLIRDKRLDNKFVFQLYGEISDDVGPSRRSLISSFGNVKLNGFETDKSKMYHSVDCVFHASGSEPLGRIFLEAIEFNKPIVGIDDGGIGEIGRILNLTSLLVDPLREDLAEGFLENLLRLHGNYEGAVREVISAREVAAAVFNPSKYSEQVDDLTGPVLGITSGIDL